MQEEVKNELKFLKEMCEAIRGLDKDVQLHIVKIYLDEEVKKETLQNKEEDAFDKAVKELQELVSYQEFYNKITDDMHIGDHGYAKQLYDTINKYFKLRHHK